jgi:hypothetical protein
MRVKKNQLETIKYIIIITMERIENLRGEP